MAAGAMEIVAVAAVVAVMAVAAGAAGAPVEAGRAAAFMAGVAVTVATATAEATAMPMVLASTWLTSRLSLLWASWVLAFVLRVGLAKAWFLI